MSDSGQGAREWRVYLDDMITFAGKVHFYTKGFDQAAFVADGLTYDATLRNLELIGERPHISPTTCAPPILKSPGG